MRHLQQPRRCFAALGWAVLLAANTIAGAIIAPSFGNAGEKAAGKGTAAIDYSKLARSLVRHPRNPVLKVGEKGSWNSQTLSCFSVLDDGDGFRRSVPKEVGIRSRTPAPPC